MKKSYFLQKILFILFFSCFLGFSKSVLAQETPQFSDEELMGKIEYPKHPDFVKVDAKYGTQGRVFYLRKGTYEAFEKLHAAAKKEGINFTIVSASRNFADQKNIWENKWQKLKQLKTDREKALNILEYSSMPSTSRHHWGTDMDLNNLTNEYFGKGQGKKEYDWLVANAHKFGFYQPYSPQNASRPEGYKEEKWHWSYMPLSYPILEQYKKRITTDSIKGFVGSESAKEIEVIKKYVGGINPACLNYVKN